MRTTPLYVAGFALLVGMSGPAIAAPAQYPNMAPLAQYMMANRDEEIALARSAAPPSISADAEVRVLGPHGYETAVKGKNGFVCIVWRSWTAPFGDPEFWNPKLLGPNCLNPAAVRSVEPRMSERTQWALSGLSQAEMLARTKAELAANSYIMPEPGAMSFMLSKQGYLSDQGSHHWHPHLMFFVPNAQVAGWGADLPGSPALAAPSPPEPVTTIFVPVRKWSDGTADEMVMK
jgi:hypothetical protein